LDLPFRPPKRSRRSPHYQTSELITAERPIGGERRLRVAPLGTRIRESGLFLVALFLTAGAFGLVVLILDSTAVPSSGNDTSLWQLFTDGVVSFGLLAIGMWLCHLATNLITHRIRAFRASEGKKISVTAGVIAYPLYLTCVWLMNLLDTRSHFLGVLLTMSTLIVPGVVATLIAPRLFWKPAEQ